MVLTVPKKIPTPEINRNNLEGHSNDSFEGLLCRAADLILKGILKVGELFLNMICNLFAQISCLAPHRQKLLIMSFAWNNPQVVTEQDGNPQASN